MQLTLTNIFLGAVLASLVVVAALIAAPLEDAAQDSTPIVEATPDAEDREPDDAQQRAEGEPTPPIDPNVLVAAWVLDAETNQPVKSFRVVPGTPYGRVTGPDDPAPAVWQPHLIREAVDGRFEWPTARTYAQFRLRFEADGYIPEISSWINRADGPQAIAIQLRRDPGIAGRVLLPDGQPAAGAVLAVGMPNRGVRLEHGNFSGADEPPPEKLSDRWRRPVFITADEQGRYRLPTEPGAAMVYAIHEAGIAEVSYAALEQSTDIRLAAWGSIDGRVLWIDKPGADELLYLSVMREGGGYPEVCSLFLSLRSDAEGRFHIGKLPPWRVQLSRSFELPDGRGGYQFPHLHVDVSPGRPTEVVFGGTGRPVIGKLVGLDSYEGITLSITPNTPRPGDQWAMTGHNLVRQSNIGPVFFRADLPVSWNGTFRIDNVIPEYYQLFVRSEDKRVYQVHQLRIEASPAERPDAPHDASEIRVARR